MSVLNYKFRVSFTKSVMCDRRFIILSISINNNSYPPPKNSTKREPEHDSTLTVTTHPFQKQPASAALSSFLKFAK